MINMVLADLFKMRKAPAMKIILAITTFCALAMTVMAYGIANGKLGLEMTSIGFMFSDINTISILGAVIASIFIAGDFDNKSIHDAIACGCSRGNIIISKAIVFFCAIVVALIPYIIITGIALSTGSEFGMGKVSIGFLNILTQESVNSFQVFEIGNIVIAMLTIVVVYVAQLSICVPLSIVLKKPVLVVAIYYVSTILFAQLSTFRGSSPMFDRIFSLTPFGGNYSLISIESGVEDIVKALLVSFTFIVVILVATYSVFRKSEIM